jgi:hypothetical protein
MRGHADFKTVCHRQRLSRSQRQPAILPDRPLPHEINLFAPAFPMSRFRTFVKWSLIAIVLVATIWLAVIIWWQTTQRVVTVQDTLVYLGVMPLTVLTCIGLLQWRSFRRKHPNASSNHQASASATPAEAENKPISLLPILSAWAVTSFATNAEEFVQALRDRQVRPLPDALLADHQGFPILTGRINDLDTTTTQDELIRIAAERKVANVPDAESWGEAFLRTLALLADLLDEVLADLPLCLDMTADLPATQGVDALTLRGAAPLPSVADEQLRLKIKLLIPPHFQPVEQQLALVYLLHRIAEMPVPNEHLHVDIVQASDDATALVLMDQFSADAYRDNRAQALLLLACDSALCDTIAEDWQANGRLFNPHSPNGLMMGEAGFAVLCANDKALKAAAIGPACRLTRLSRAHRDASADTQGKPSYACLANVVKEALLAANLPGESVGTVACDADHRTNRTLECMGAMMDQTPHLDAIQNRLAAAEACGHIGAASVAGALVAAIMQSKNSEHPVLLFNVSHVTDRAAALLIPSGAAAA